METNILELFRIIFGMDMDSIIMQMAKFIKANGRKIKKIKSDNIKVII